jgi:hypothetical protein
MPHGVYALMKRQDSASISFSDKELPREAEPH